LTALVCATAVGSVKADSISDFYKANPINLYVGAAPGGGYDMFARLLARHLGRHIPGSPSVIVKNLSGADGAVAANYVYNIARRDGTNLVMPQNTLTIDQLTGMSSVKFDMRRFQWIGSLNTNQSVCIFSRRVAPLSRNDFFARQFVIGGSGGVTASPTLVPTLTNELAGTKFKIINGYEGTNVAFLAVDRGEIDGICGIGWDSVKVQASDRLKSGDLVVGLDVGITRDSELKSLGVPFFLDLIPDGPDKQALQLIFSVQLYGRPFAMPPGTPDDRLGAIRKAFQETMTDDAFVADAMRSRVQIQPLSPEKVLSTIDLPFDAPERIRDRVIDALRKAGWGGGQRR
jgi:tripartite-type tricarboxylate transporter receptor subunit TctC